MLDARAVKAGLLYCGVIFSAGFVLGVVRTLAVTPLAGELVSVMLQAPVMLAVAWYACNWVIERLEVAPHLLDRLIMGGVALAALIGAEAFAAVLAGSGSVADYFHTFGRSALLLGLLAQLAFALFPMLRRRNGI